MSEVETNKSVWEQIADLFYCGQTEEGMELFMANVAVLGQLPSATRWIHPLFDALEQGDMVYAADLLRYEIAGQ